MNRFLSKIILVLITFMFLTACSSTRRYVKDNNDKRYKRDDNTERVEFNNPAPLKVITGVASYYAHKYHGRLTANGETYDMYGLTAAHPTLPFDTIIKVTNLSNNKSTVIRINDRMPQHVSRIIDLSLGTAQEIDMIEAGIQEVKLEILKWGAEQ